MKILMVGSATAVAAQYRASGRLLKVIQLSRNVKPHPAMVAMGSLNVNTVVWAHRHAKNSNVGRRVRSHRTHRRASLCALPRLKAAGSTAAALRS
eukprot:364930-Chlamydomonas_euryale.AAC.4